MKRKKHITEDRAKAIFREHEGVLRTREALGYGIHPKTLYRMRDKGLVETMARGLYRLTSMPMPGYQDLVTVACQVPKARICLISALSFHGITTEIPHSIYCALPRDIHKPTQKFPPLRTFRFSDASYSAGVEVHKLDGIPVQIYSVEKTIADCFQYRNKIGMDVVIEALRYYRERKPLKVNDIMSYARICRIERILSPYLEALL